MPFEDLAVVVIGRNEGARLVRCLESVRDHATTVVYVDSASTDGSVAAAGQLQAQVVNLDMSRPFSAARARNEGARAALAAAPNTQFIQFIDGDCELIGDWLAKARDLLLESPTLGAVCGRRRERHPQHAIYNRLCDAEWNTPVGPATAFGGDVMLRVQALLEAGWYRDDVIAGEEPELSIRLRRKGWQILRADADMTHHDAAILQFKQWWKRTVRCGYAYALGAHLHGQAVERHWVRERNRALTWGLALPTLLVLCASWNGWVASALLMGYPAQALRLASRSPQRGADRLTDGILSVVGKFAETRGILQFARDRLTGNSPQIIEYK
jgi:glycosyltransferase involved in cell wall biosynthesis